MLAARYARDGVNDKAEEGPEEAGDFREGATQGLDGEAGGVGIWDVVGATERIRLLLGGGEGGWDVHDGEGKEEENELSSSFPGGEDLAEEAASPTISKGVCVRLVRDGH